MNLSPNHREALLRAGSFMLRVVSSADWLAIRSEQHQALLAHETVLRPLLSSCSEAWAYEIKEPSPVFAVAKNILHRERGKFRIDLSGDPIRGHELFWNASGGQRGSIALVIPAAVFPAELLYSNCQQAFILGNSTVPHTPGALRFARAKVAGGDTVCCLLSRTNGLEWISVFASPDALESMLLQAQSLVIQRALYADSTA